MSLREKVKRYAPGFARDAVIAARTKLSAPPLEQIALHDYTLIPDPGSPGRLTLVIPTVAAKAIFGGVATGLDFFFALAKALNRPARIVIDDFNDATDHAYIRRAADAAGYGAGSIECVGRTAQNQELPVRKDDLFLAYNWWTALNLRGLLAQQTNCFGGASPKPLLYILQEYEPSFHAMSSTHMMARAALDSKDRTFGIFNSHELRAYFHAQDHAFEREFIIPLRMSRSLKAARRGEEPQKSPIVLVYGRPSVARNCFPAIVASLKNFVGRHEEFHDWSFESAGEAHGPVDLGCGKRLLSLGKISIHDYARKLETAAVGLSLMSSPHPSYPPLEMAHFGLLTVTNRYACKDLSTAHENILSIENILPETIAGALARQCHAFRADRQAGWRGKSLLPAYFSDEAYPFMNEIVEAIRPEIA